MSSATPSRRIRKGQHQISTPTPGPSTPSKSKSRRTETKTPKADIPNSKPNTRSSAESKSSSASPDLDEIFQTKDKSRKSRREVEVSTLKGTPKNADGAKTKDKQRKRKSEEDVVHDNQDPYLYPPEEDSPPRPIKKQKSLRHTKSQIKNQESFPMEQSSVSVSETPPSSRQLRTSGFKSFTENTQSPASLNTTTPSRKLRTRITSCKEVQSPPSLDQSPVSTTPTKNVTTPRIKGHKGSQSPTSPAIIGTPRRTKATTTSSTPKSKLRKSPRKTKPSPLPKAEALQATAKKLTPIKIKLPKVNGTPARSKENNNNSTLVVNSPAPAPPVKRLKKIIGECPFPCREEQFQDIYGFLRRNLEQGDSRCMYVSGVPGTGKTAIVKAAVDDLKESCEEMKFKYVYINGLSLSAPDKIWKRLWNEVDPKKGEKVRLTSDKALTKLRLYFEMSNHVPVVLVVDELDQLMDKHQSILYTLLDWTNHPPNLFSLICIFNTMNLPENALTLRNASRMGMVRSVFPPYTHEQLATIVAKYIGDEGTSKLKHEALGLLCKKVAAISGDARRALEIAKRTLELLEHMISPAAAVQEAFKELFSSPKIQAVRSCSALEKLILKTICSELQGNESASNETKVSTIINGVLASAPYENISIGVDPVFHCLRRLYECKLILIENSTAASIHSKLSLNIAIPDVQFAMGIKESDVDKI